MGFLITWLILYFIGFGRTDGESLMDYKILWSFVSSELNPLVTNGLSHPYHLDKSIFIFRDIRSNFSFIFSMKFMYANRMASHLGLFCLPMSHKKDTRHIWVNIRTDRIIHPNYSD